MPAESTKKHRRRTSCRITAAAFKSAAVKVALQQCSPKRKRIFLALRLAKLLADFQSVFSGNQHAVLKPILCECLCTPVCLTNNLTLKPRTPEFWEQYSRTAAGLQNQYQLSIPLCSESENILHIDKCLIPGTTTGDTSNILRTIALSIIAANTSSSAFCGEHVSHPYHYFHSGFEFLQFHSSRKSIIPQNWGW